MAEKEVVRDERRLLLIRAGAAAGIVVAMLIGLALWERSNRTDEEEVRAPSKIAAPATIGIREITPESAPVAPETATSAPEPEASVPAGGVNEAAEETRGVESLPGPAAPRAARTPAPATTTDKSHLTLRAEGQQQPATIQHLPAGQKPPPGKAFVLQVGVFSNPNNAEDLRAKLALAGIPVMLETRVQVGPFKTRDEVVQAQSKLKALGMERGQLMLVKP
ncbi:MAG: SPOR domain-containing protein [Betaproteobacteria bacterium]|nr:SPOR domain-containing protein [Betaproteobacteria bacterium]